METDYLTRVGFMASSRKYSRKFQNFETTRKYRRNKYKGLTINSNTMCDSGWNKTDDLICEDGDSLGEGSTAPFQKIYYQD